MEYVYPTRIQQEAYSVILSGRDMVGVAQTGTGKTLAYLLPILRQLPYSEQRNPRILILVPTRELVLQVAAEIEKLTAYITVRVATVYGGVNINPQKQAVHQGVDILVGTPGRAYDLAMTGILRFKSIQKLVVDEVDEMLNLGFRPQLEAIMDTLPPRRQNLLFSATLSEGVEKIIDTHFAAPEKIIVAPHGTPLEEIQLMGYHVPNYHTKVNLLKHLLKEREVLKKVLVFVDSKKLADKLYEKIAPTYEGEVGIIHSNKAQNTRIKAIQRFQEEEIRVLIATDIIARGIDFREISHVINFDMPESPGDFIHRIGRTGRAGQYGIALAFVNEKEEEQLLEIEKLIHKKLPFEEIPQEVEISKIFTPEERPKLFDKNYLGTPSRLTGGGAFHEKSAKNRQRNSGSPALKRPKKKKGPKRSGKKR
ncbi:MAG: DEAD/DEAH box helicase [Bacteroidetes bacterium]|nr:MAG: DEAD/DEAH box helicase [Bacteroidota bacterium]